MEIFLNPPFIRHVQIGDESFERRLKMTWWEAEQMAVYVSETEAALEEWTMSGPQMRIEQNNVDRVAKKLNATLAKTTEPEKKAFIEHLAGRVEVLRQHLTERLKRDIPSYQPSHG
jgi:hypothetical protein